MEQNVAAPRFGASPDRRGRPRLNLACDLRVDLPGDVSLHAQTQDINCESFFFLADVALALGQIIECDLAIPSRPQRNVSEPLQQFERDSIVLRCQATVVRIVPQANKNTFGVACRLRDYTTSRLDAAINLVVFDPPSSQAL